MIVSFTQKIRMELEGFGRAANSLEGFDKLAKFTIPVLNAVQEIGSSHLSHITKSALGAMGFQLKEFTDLAGSVNIVTRFRDWTNSEKRPSWFTTKWWKMAFVTAANVLETIKFANMLGFVPLGEFAAKTFSFRVFGHIVTGVPGIGLMKDIFIGISSIYSLKLNMDKVNTFNPENELGINAKIDKWEFKKEIMECLLNDANNLEEVEGKGKEKEEEDSQGGTHLNSLIREWSYAKRSIHREPSKPGRVSLRARLDRIKNDRNVERTEKERQLQPLHAQLESKIDAINSIDLSDEIVIDQVEKNVLYCDWKIKTWKCIRKLERKDIKNARLGIITDIFKMAIITLSLASIYIFATLTMTIPFIVLGLPLGYVGYRKFYVESKLKEMAVPRRDSIIA